MLSFWGFHGAVASRGALKTSLCCPGAMGLCEQHPPPGSWQRGHKPKNKIPHGWGLEAGFEDAMKQFSFGNCPGKQLGEAALTVVAARLGGQTNPWYPEEV